MLHALDSDASWLHGACRGVKLSRLRPSRFGKIFRSKVIFAGLKVTFHDFGFLGMGGSL